MSRYIAFAMLHVQSWLCLNSGSNTLDGAEAWSNSSYVGTASKLCLNIPVAAVSPGVVFTIKRIVIN